MLPTYIGLYSYVGIFILTHVTNSFLRTKTMTYVLLTSYDIRVSKIEIRTKVPYAIGESLEMAASELF